MSIREREILAALALGNSVRDVASQLCRRPKTINSQCRSLLRKLELRNTAGLTRFAIHAGLVSI